MKHIQLQYLPLRNRHWPLAMIVLAGCSWADVTLAQDPTTPGNAADPEGKVAPASASGSDASGTTTPAATGKPSPAYRKGASTGTGSTSKKSPFAYSSGDTETPQSKPAPKITRQDAETEAAGAQGRDSEVNGSRFVAPSFYGRGQQVVTPGQGQFARPKFRYGISVGIGYDDNTDSAPSVNLSAVATPRNRSGFAWVNGHWDAQWLKPRTVFTVNLEAGGNFYFDRPGNSSDFNARLGMMYIHKIDPLTQFSANASFAFLSQPDYGNLYASTSQAGGDYFTGSTKFDLTHRWAPHFSTTTSASVNLLKYAEDSAAKLSNSYWSFIFGNEFRFQSSPRYTWVIEGRYELDDYISNSALNSQTAYVLGGLDWIASRYLTATVRAGASIRSYDAGGSNTAPYAEVALNYRTGRHSTLSLNARYGFEQSTSAGDDNLSYRLGLVYERAFTSRFSANTGFSFIHSDNTHRTGASSSTDVLDINLGLQYRIDRHFSIGARYAYTLQNSSSGTQDFDRNRVLFSAQYEY